MASKREQCLGNSLVEGQRGRRHTCLLSMGHTVSVTSDARGLIKHMCCEAASGEDGHHAGSGSVQQETDQPCGLQRLRSNSRATQKYHCAVLSPTEHAGKETHKRGCLTRVLAA